MTSLFFLEHIKNNHDSIDKNSSLIVKRIPHQKRTRNPPSNSGVHIVDVNGNKNSSDATTKKQKSENTVCSFSNISLPNGHQHGSTNGHVIPTGPTTNAPDLIDASPMTNAMNSINSLSMNTPSAGVNSNLNGVKNLGSVPLNQTTTPSPNKSRSNTPSGSLDAEIAKTLASLSSHTKSGKALSYGQSISPASNKYSSLMPLSANDVLRGEFGVDFGQFLSFEAKLAKNFIQNLALFRIQAKIL